MGTLMPSQVIKTKPPPQILPKPAAGTTPLTSSVSTTCTGKLSSQPTLQAQTLAQPQGAYLFNQMLPNGAVLVQQQTSSGVQFILKSPQPQHKTGLVLANGGLHQPQALFVQGRTQAHQFLRLVPGQMQLQQIQTSSGPAFIAVPTAQAAPALQRSSPSPQTQPAAIAFAHKKLKKKKKREDEPPPPPTHHRLDLANLIKISGIEDEDVIATPPSSSSSTPPVVQSPSPQPPPPPPKPAPTLMHQTTPPPQQISAKQFNPSQLLAQLQSPAQATGVTPSIAAAAQSQLAQLIADHGGQILQTAVLQFQGASADGMVLKGIPNHAGSVVVSAAGATTSNIRRTPVVMAPTIQQNGVRLVADLNGTLQQASSSLTEHNRLIMSSLAPAMLEQNRVQIVTGVPTSSALQMEQQNRLIMSAGTPNAMLTQQGRVLVSTGSLEQHQNRVQIVTSNSSAVSLTEQNRVIVSNVPSNVGLDQHNRLQFMSTGLQNSLMGEQNRVIVSGVQGNMSLSEQNRVQFVAGSQGSGMIEQNRVIMSGVQSSLEQQNRLQIVSGVPNSGNTLSMSEQNRVHIVSNMPNSNILSEKQNLVQIVNSNISLSEEQNRVQIVTSMANQLPEQSRLHIVNSIPSSNSISLSEQNHVQLVTNVPVSRSFTLSDNVQLVTSLPNSVAEQNKIHFSSMAHSNSLSVPNHQHQQVHMVTSMPNSTENKVQVVTSLPSVYSSVDQNKVQVVTSLPSVYSSVDHSKVQVVTSLPSVYSSVDHSKVQVVTSLPSVYSSVDHSKVQVVTSLPSVYSSVDHSKVQVVTSLPSVYSSVDHNKVQVVTSLPSVYSSVDHNKVQVVTSLPSVYSSVDQNKVQVVTSLPSVYSSVDQSQQQTNKVHFAFKNHSAPLEQKRNVISYHNDHSNVQVVSALVNSDKDRLQPQPQQQFVKPEPRVIGKDKELRIEEREDGSKVLVSALDQNMPISSPGSAIGSLGEIVPTRVQYVTDTQEDSRIQVVGANNHHTSVISQGNQVRTSVVYSHDVSPKMAKSPGSATTNFTSPINSPPPAAALSPAAASPATFNNRPNLTVVTAPTRPVEPKQDPNSMVAVSTSSKTAQTNTPRRTYDNAFLDSIAQAHPSLVINKSSPPQASKIIKGKKPIKKAALVKPMMAEDRSIGVGVDKSGPDPPNLVPITTNDIGSPPPPPPPPQVPPSNVVSRVQTIQLTPQKQQQLKLIQAQVYSLTANKFRSAAENATLQRLVSEQKKILLGGKLIPTVPGQHAQGVAFVSTSSGGVPTSSAPSQVRHHSTTAQAQQHGRGVVTSSVEQQVQTPITMSQMTSPVPMPQPQPVAPQPPKPHAPHPSMPHLHSTTSHSVSQGGTPQKPQPQPVLTTHVNKATSPIPTQTAVSTQTPQPSPPQPAPIFTRAKRAQLIEQQFQADRQGALAPDTHTPFTCKADAVKRLIRYHTLNEPVLSEKDLSKADEIFEQTAQTLLDRKTNMYNKFALLLLKESMRIEKTSELVQLHRLAIEEEQFAQAAQVAAASISTASASTSCGSPHNPIAGTSRQGMGSAHVGCKRERDDDGGPGDPKRHCPDDEEINAQVQSAIDSILNLQRKAPP